MTRPRGHPNTPFLIALGKDKMAHDPRRRYGWSTSHQPAWTRTTIKKKVAHVATVLRRPSRVYEEGQRGGGVAFWNGGGTLQAGPRRRISHWRERGRAIRQRLSCLFFSDSVASWNDPSSGPALYPSLFPRPLLRLPGVAFEKTLHDAGDPCPPRPPPHSAPSPSRAVLSTVVGTCPPFHGSLF